MSDTLLHSDLLIPMLHCFCDLLVTDARSVQSYIHGRVKSGSTCHLSLYSCLDSFAKVRVPLGCPCLGSRWGAGALVVMPRPGAQSLEYVLLRNKGLFGFFNVFGV